jgi:hypothetical protein
MTSSINFRKTRKGYSADYQRADGLGYEQRYYSRVVLQELCRYYGWSTPEDSSTDDLSIAEELIIGGMVKPYRVVSL